jgi:hypothetical protein
VLLNPRRCVAGFLILRIDEERIEFNLMEMSAALKTKGDPAGIIEVLWVIALFGSY